jgi:hypothetical protein
MCCGILKAAGGLGAIVALILLVIALLKQLISLVGFLLREDCDRRYLCRAAHHDRAGDLPRPFTQAQQRGLGVSRRFSRLTFFCFHCTLLIFSLQSCNNSVGCDRVLGLAAPAEWVSPRRDLGVFNPFAAYLQKKVTKTTFPVFAQIAFGEFVPFGCCACVCPRSNRSTIQNGQRRPILRLYHCPHFPF